MKYQVTLFDPNNKYKPVSCLLDYPGEEDGSAIKKRGLIKICQSHYWTSKDLKRLGYSKIKYRKYVDTPKI